LQRADMLVSATGLPTMRFSKGNLSGSQKWMLALLLLLPLVVAAGKWSVLPTSEFLTRSISLVDIPDEMQRRVHYVLFVPLGAILIVLCRLTFGIRLFGPFRSILLAVAFQITGIVLGIIFLILTVGAVAVIRPELKRMRLPYFSRVSVTLSLVSVIIIATMLSAVWLDAGSLQRVAYFPLVVLCLIGEAFARTLQKEGLRSALWRGTMTVMVGVLLTLLAGIPELRQLMLRFPELLVAQIGCIMVISEFLDLRLFEWLNPAAAEEDEGKPGGDAPAIVDGSKNQAA
jgi:hypothetical protein